MDMKTRTSDFALKGILLPGLSDEPLLGSHLRFAETLQL
jgi:hypothetical protein